MSDVAIHADHVWKKFRKGELHDSLRDLIPAVAKRLVGKGPKSDSLSTREFWALQDVSFEVARGESLGIIGPNGAGKSTMLKLLSRIIKPNRGSYWVHGRLSALIEVGAGFHQDLTGKENIYLNGTILGMSRKEIKAKEEQIIDFSGIEDFIDTPVKRYSSGMKARLGFSVAAHMEPDVLLVDEVLSVGDARFRGKCIQHMQDLLASDVTVVFISHLLDQVRSLCSRTLVLDKGQVVFNGQTDAAIRKYLDILSTDNHHSDGLQQQSAAEIRNIRLCNTEGQEVLQWQVSQPGVLEFEVVLHRAVEQPVVLINFSSLGGAYLGTVNSSHSSQQVIPSEPGTYPMRYTLDPNPLAEGDYLFSPQVREEGGRICLWAPSQPRALTVAGPGNFGSLLRFHGTWEVVENQPV